MALRPALAQLLIAELGLGAIAAGLALIAATDGAAPLIGAIALLALGAVLVLGAVVRFQGRWLYQHAIARARLRRGAARRRGPDAAAGPLSELSGGYVVEAIPGPRQSTLGAVRCGTTWTVALEIAADDLLGDDPPVPLRDLPSLLRIEDVPLAQVRLLTFAAPAPDGGAVPRTAARLCLLSVDTRAAAEALTARGGSRAALAQILRRCVLRAEELLAAHGVTTRPVDPAAMTRALDVCLGALAPDARPQEHWSHVSFGAAQSVSVALGGDAARGLAVADHLLAALPGPLAASAVVVAPSGAGPVTTLVVRGGGPDAAAIARRVRPAAQQGGLRVDELHGRQRDALLLTVPLAASR